MSNNSPNNKEHPFLHWSDETEEILQNWGNISKVYSFLHEQAYIKNNRRNLSYQIPSIIVSTLSGFISMSLSTFALSQTNKNYFSFGIGCLNIWVAIISTVLSILKYSELSQKHYTTSTAFKKLHIDIETELSLERHTRKDINTFLKVCKQQFEILCETSPIIDKDIIQKFNKIANIEIKNLPAEINLKFTPIKVVVNENKIYEISN